jgi:hypothetical protein
MSSQECDESVDLRKSGNWFITTGVLMIVSVYYHIDHHVMYYLQANRFFLAGHFLPFLWDGLVKPHGMGADKGARSQ